MHMHIDCDAACIDLAKKKKLNEWKEVRENPNIRNWLSTCNMCERRELFFLTGVYVYLFPQC